MPTEAEWEYACRAGTTTPFYMENSPSAEEANYYGHYPYGIEDNYFSQSNLEVKPGEYRETTVAVESFSANPYGLYNIERIDIPESEEERQWLDKQNFKNTAEDAYTG